MHALRVSLVVGLLFTFAAPAAASDAQGVAAFLDGVRSFFASVWNKEGCRIDPLGGCVTTPQTKAGCWIDPLGRCVTTPPPDSTADLPDTTGLRPVDRE